jgi:uncharacterized BrkB/YihY/UPF0761 family membrane protein
MISLLLLLYNGSRLFATMQTVFNRAYYVDNRNFLMANAVAVLMLLVITFLLLVSTVAVGVGSLLGGASDAVFGALPIQVPGRGLAGQAISWGLSALSAVLLFVLMYKILLNARQGWRDVLPGALAAIVLFFGILLVFPIYLGLFPPNQAYAAFGIFLVFTFYLYLLGFVFVFGAELNAFLQDPTGRWPWPRRRPARDAARPRSGRVKNSKRRSLAVRQGHVPPREQTSLRSQSSPNGAARAHRQAYGRGPEASAGAWSGWRRSWRQLCSFAGGRAQTSGGALLRARAALPTTRRL